MKQPQFSKTISLLTEITWNKNMNAVQIRHRLINTERTWKALKLSLRLFKKLIIPITTKVLYLIKFDGEVQHIKGRHSMQFAEIWFQLWNQFKKIYIILVSVLYNRDTIGQCLVKLLAYFLVYQAQLLQVCFGQILNLKVFLSN